MAKKGVAQRVLKRKASEPKFKSDERIEDSDVDDDSLVVKTTSHQPDRKKPKTSEGGTKTTRTERVETNVPAKGKETTKDTTKPQIASHAEHTFSTSTMSSFGAFATLPVELRFMIWELVLCGDGDQSRNSNEVNEPTWSGNDDDDDIDDTEDSEDSGEEDDEDDEDEEAGHGGGRKRATKSPDPFSNRETGIVACMRLSKAIHAEIASGILYDNQTLEFTIQPETPEGQPCGIDVCFAGGRRRWQTKLSHSYYANGGFCEGSRLRLQRWHKMPIHKFRGVVINILPPDQHDPGELVSLWNDLTWLLDRFENRGAAIEEIKFKATKTRKWMDWTGASWFDIGNEEPDWIGHADAHPRHPVSSILELFMMPINQHNLQSVSNVEIGFNNGEITEAKNRQTSEDIEMVDLHTEVRLEHNLQSSMNAEVDADDMEVVEAEEEQQTFGVPGSDNDVEVAEWSLYLDMLLDTLPGAAAERLRLERLATWSDEYFWGTFTNLRSSSRQIQSGHHPLITSDQKPPPETVPASLSYDTVFIETDYLHLERPDCETYPARPNLALRSFGLRLLQRRLIAYRFRYPFVQFYTKQCDEYGIWWKTEKINGADICCCPEDWWGERYEGWERKPPNRLGRKLNVEGIRHAILKSRCRVTDLGLDHVEEVR